MQHVVEVAGAGVLLVMGLSQMYAGRGWAAFYRAVAARGPQAVRLYGVVVLALGGAVILLHNVWSGTAMVLTLFGWLAAAEGLMCLAVPQLGLMSLAALDEESRARAVFAVGVAAVIGAGVLWAGLLWN